MTLNLCTDIFKGKGEEKKESQNSTIMNRLRSEDGYKVVRCYDESAKRDKLVQTDLSGKELKTLHYFYGCGKRKEDILEKAGTRRDSSSTYQFVKFFAREDMEKYGVQF